VIFSKFEEKFKEIPFEFLNLLKAKKIKKPKLKLLLSKLISDKDSTELELDQIDYSSELDETNRLADFVSLSDMSKHENEMSDEFKKFTFYPKVRAEKYNEIFKGAFLHSTHNLDVFFRQHFEANEKTSEICVSTLRNDSIFEFPLGRTFALAGFGNIKYIYNFDAYSEKVKNGKRIAKSSSAKVEDKEKDIFYRGHRMEEEGYSERLHYDEGFMDVKECEILICIIPSKKYKQDVKRILKKYGTFCEILTYDFFKKIHNSDNLLSLLYRIKQKKMDLELQNNNMGTYDESIQKSKIPTFKEFASNKLVHLL